MARSHPKADRPEATTRLIQPSAHRHIDRKIVDLCSPSRIFDSCQPGATADLPARGRNQPRKFVSLGNRAARLCTLRRLHMKKKHTVVARLQDELRQEIQQSALRLIS